MSYLFRWLFGLTLMLCLCAPAVASANPLALHATAAEVGIWKERRARGPYLDGWQRILSRANAFKANPTGTWPGNQLTARWDPAAVMNCQQRPNYFPGGSSSDCNGSRAYGDGARDAGFVYLVTGDASYRNPLRTLLLQQAAMPGADFRNGTKWPNSPMLLSHENYAVANWLRKLTYGYSYIRSSLPSSEQATLDAWFIQAATYWNGVVERGQNTQWPNRLSFADPSQYPLPVSDEADNLGRTHFGGYQAYDYHHTYSNIPATHMAMVTAVAVVTNNAMLKAKAKRFFKEWLTFAVAADGTVYDQVRWNNAGDPRVGFGYEGTALGSMISIADHLARDGDPELMTYSTSAGFHDWGGGPKSLLKAMQHYAGLVIAERGVSASGGVHQYASRSATTSTSLLIGPGPDQVKELVLIPATLFHKDRTVTTAYTRPLPSSPSSGGYDPWGGDWGTYPDVRFMFGQLEGVVWPYPKGGPVLPIPQALHILGASPK
jgi:hypothetical protein